MFKNTLKISLFFTVLITANSVFSQKWELGGMLGASNYNGDLARNLVLIWNNVFSIGKLLFSQKGSVLYIEHFSIFIPEKSKYVSIKEIASVGYLNISLCRRESPGFWW